MIQLNEDLIQFENLLNLLLLKPNDSACLPKFGCIDLKKSHVLYLENQIRLELNIIDLSPKRVIFESCTFVNESHIYENNCNVTKQVDKQDCFYYSTKAKAILLISNGKFSFSCSKTVDMYINEEPYICGITPKQFFTRLFSFKININDDNYILKEIDTHHLGDTYENDTNMSIFFQHVNMQQVNNENMDFFEYYLPKVSVSPTIFGVLLILVIIFVMTVTGCLLLYCFNATVNNLIQVYLCCKKKEDNAINKIKRNENLVEKISSSNESLHILMNMTPFSRSKKK